MTSSTVDSTLPLAAAVCLMSAVIHVAVAPEHFDEYALFGALFVIAAALQGLWALAAFKRPSPAVLLAGVALNAGIAAVWVWSRTAGLPLGPEAGAAEAIGPLDVASTADELAVAVIAWMAWRSGRGRCPLTGSTAVEVLALGLLAVSALVLVGGDGMVH